MEANIMRMVNDDYMIEIETIIKSKRRLYYISNITEYLAQLFINVSIILAFLCANYKYTPLIIASGCAGVLNISMMRLSHYARSEMLERADTLQKSLATIKLENVPQIVVPDDSTL